MVLTRRVSDFHQGGLLREPLFEDAVCLNSCETALYSPSLHDGTATGSFSITLPPRLLLSTLKSFNSIVIRNSQLWRIIANSSASGTTTTGWLLIASAMPRIEQVPERPCIIKISNSPPSVTSFVRIEPSTGTPSFRKTPSISTSCTGAFVSASINTPLTLKRPTRSTHMQLESSSSIAVSVINAMIIIRVHFCFL